MYSKIPINLSRVALPVIDINQIIKKLKMHDIQYMQVLYFGFYFSNYYCHISSLDLQFTKVLFAGFFFLCPRELSFNINPLQK